MLHLHWLSQAWSRALEERPAKARIRLLTNLACVSLALVLLVGIGGGLIASSRLAQVTDDEVPSLRESRDLSEVLAATAEALRGTDLAGSLSRLGRADSLAERFHLLAASARLHERHAAAMRSADERFASYYAQARRAAQYLPSGDDALTSSSELALVGDRAVRGILIADMAATEREIATQVTSAQRIQAATWATMTVLGVLASLLLLSLSAAINEMQGRTLRRLTTAARTLAEGESDLELPTTTDDDLRAMQQALVRVAATITEHALAAEALAEGRARRVSGPTRLDRVTSALARVATYEDELAASARRIADGDLTAAVTPRGAHDLLGRAHEEMVNALGRFLAEIEGTSLAIAETAERMHDAADRVASGASDGAERVRRTADSLARMTADVQGAAARAQSVENRAMESAATAQEGSAVLHESLDALTAVLREASVVESIANDAGLLAVNAAIEAARAGDEGNGFSVVADEVRLLAQHANRAAREINQISSSGASRAERSAELLDRLAPSIDDSSAMVHELAVSARRQADELVALGGALGTVNETTRRTATGATQLRMSADALASHALRLGAVLRGFRGREAKLAIA